MSQAYPLSWPSGRPRTPHSKRKPGQFKQDGRRIPPAQAFDRAEMEVARLGGRYPLLSTNVELRRDGKPRADRAPPTDPGVCLYFEIGGKPYALACDAYETVAQNIAALAAHMEATRAIERHGVATAAETLQAFVALPQPKCPHEILGIAPTAAPAEIKAAWRKAIGSAHPDQGGSHTAAAEINAARDAMLGSAWP